MDEPLPKAEDVPSPLPDVPSSLPETRPASLPETRPAFDGSGLTGASPTTSGVAAPAPPERVVGGLVMASLGVIGGIIITTLLWQSGFVAAAGSFAMAFGAVYLYPRGAGSTPRKGAWPLVALVVVGLVVAFFACVASDLSTYYDENATADAAMTKMQFISAELFDPALLGSYGKDILMFVAFGALGMFRTIRQVLVGRRVG